MSVVPLKSKILNLLSPLFPAAVSGLISSCVHINQHTYVILLFISRFFDVNYQAIGQFDTNMFQKSLFIFYYGFL